MIEEGFPALLKVNVEANPPPGVAWQHEGQPVELGERKIQLENGSLNITTSEMADSGTWTIVADNGLGQKARKQIALTVHPARLAIEVHMFAYSSCKSSSKYIVFIFLVRVD